MAQLARLGFILLGLHLILDPLGDFSHQLPLLRAGEYRLQTIAFALSFWVAFALIPGVVLVFRGRAIALALFPETRDEAELDAQALLHTGIVILGAYLIVDGAARSGGALLMVGAAHGLPGVQELHLASVIRGGFNVVAGALLIAKSRAICGYLIRSKRPTAV